MSALHTCHCGTCSECGAGAASPGRRGMVASDRTHTALKARLLDGFALAPKLDGLTTRAGDDPAIALADVWAASLNVLSFYLERAYTESYIGTATDIESVRGLAGQVGYAPRPAISASTVLAFTTDDFKESPEIVPIRKGSKVQTIPGPGELPVLFETFEDLEARPVWNRIPAKRWEFDYPGKGDGAVRVKETLLAARVGDIIGFILATGKKSDAGTFELARIDSMESHSTAESPHYLIKLDQQLKVLDKNPTCRIAVFSRRASLFGYNATSFLMLDRDVRQRMLRLDLTGEDPAKPTIGEWKGLHASVKKSLTELKDFRPLQFIPAEDKTIDLDAIYPEAMVNRFVVLKSPKGEGIFRITEVAEVARSDHGISSKVSRLTLDRDIKDYDDYVRDTAVYIQSEELHLAPSPYTKPQPYPDGRTIALSDTTTLSRGRLVLVQGKKSGGDHTRVAEPATVERIGVTPEGYPAITFSKALKYSYEPGELVILGNAVRATHGETKTTVAAMRPSGSKLPIGEVLGSGDARRFNQAFALQQPNLTFVPATNSLGFAPDIEVRVDDALRPREERLYGLPETSRAYALETAPDGRTMVRFAGRLRTGDGNVTCVYRIGGGIGGNLAPGRLKTPMTMTFGLREVTNPVPAEGGVAPEDVAAVRGNAPVRIIALDRIVSTKDYEAFARAYGEITKAQASVLWVDQREVVHLTVAGANGSAVEPGSMLHENLKAAIRDASQPGRAFKLLAARKVKASAVIRLKTDPAFDRKSVEADVRNALAQAFAPERRNFAAPLAKSAILACVQGVPGVLAAVVKELNSEREPTDTEILGASGAAVGDPALGAEFLTLAAEDVKISEFAS